MKKVVFYLFVLAFFASCNKSVNHDRHIPSNAAMVAVMDVQKMTLKAFDMSMLLEDNVFDNKKSQNPNSQNVPIEESGIDFLNKTYVIAHVADNEADNYMGLILPLTDPYKFRLFASSYAVKKPGEGASNVSYVMVGEGAILGWNQESAIYLVNQNIKDEFLLISELFRLFDLPEANQMVLKNESFKKTQNESFDISLWLDLNKLNKYRNPLGMIIPGQRVSKGIYNAWIDFEKGEMKVRTRYYSNNTEDPEKRDGALLLKESVNANLMSGVDKERMLGSFNLGLNMPIIKDQMDMDGILDSSQTYLELVNTNSREILDMLSGDITSCILDNGDDTDFFVAFGIKNQETSNKIIHSLDEFGLIKDFGTYYTLFNQYIILSEKDRLVVSSDFDLIKGIINGNKGLPHQELFDQISSNPFVFYLDMSDLPLTSYKRMKGYWKDIPVDTDEIEKIYFSQSSISDGISNGEAYVLFKNKDKNCLTIIAKALKKYHDNIES